MTLKRKSFRFTACAALLICGAGCSGINMQRSVSPASFFLPGLLKADPPVRMESPQPGQILPLEPGEYPLSKPSFVQQVAFVR